MPSSAIYFSCARESCPVSLRITWSLTCAGYVRSLARVDLIDVANLPAKKRTAFSELRWTLAGEALTPTFLCESASSMDASARRRDCGAGVARCGYACRELSARTAADRSRRCGLSLRTLVPTLLWRLAWLMRRRTNKLDQTTSFRVSRFAVACSHHRPPLYTPRRGFFRSERHESLSAVPPLLNSANDAHGPLHGLCARSTTG